MRAKILIAFLLLPTCLLVCCGHGLVTGHKSGSSQVNDEEFPEQAALKRNLARHTRSQGYFSVNQDIAVLADYIQDQILRKRLQEARDYLNNL